MQAAMLGFMGLVLAFGSASQSALRRTAKRQSSTVQCHRHHLPASPDPAGTHPHAIAGSTAAVHRLQHPDRPDGAGQLRTGRGHRRQPAHRTSPVERGRGALAAQPIATPPRLYVESLNETLDAQSTRIYGLDNRVPTAVLAPGDRRRCPRPRVARAPPRRPRPRPHHRASGRSIGTLTLVITLDLDRPVRGLIQVSATPLTEVRASMADPPASAGP